MQNENLIPASVCCEHYHVQLSFIQSLQQYGFINIITVDADQFINMDELQTLEKFIRLHYELDINMEGLEAINHILNRVQNMQDEITYLKSRLKIFES